MQPKSHCIKYRMVSKLTFREVRLELIKLNLVRIKRVDGGRIIRRNGMTTTPILLSQVLLFDQCKETFDFIF